MREMRIWPQYAAKCYKNAGKFFPDVGATSLISNLPYELPYKLPYKLSALQASRFISL